jgi:hypothetical protein
MFAARVPLITVGRTRTPGRPRSVWDVRRKGVTTMKFTTLAVAGMLGLTAPAFAASTMTGVISDSKCAASHAMMKEHDAKMTDTMCTNECVKMGAKYVFVQNGKVLQIANQDFKALPTLAGQQVQLTGDLKGDSVTVTKIEAAKK